MRVSCLRNSKRRTESPFNGVLNSTNEEITELHYLGTKEFISKALLLKNLPLPLFAKEGFIPSLWQREVRRDFVIDVFHL